MAMHSVVQCFAALFMILARGGRQQLSAMQATLAETAQESDDSYVIRSYTGTSSTTTSYIYTTASVDHNPHPCQQLEEYAHELESAMTDLRAQVKRAVQDARDAHAEKAELEAKIAELENTISELTATQAPTPAPSCDETITSSDKGWSYRGCQTKTRSGRTCQPWASQCPHTHTWKPTGKGANESLTENYCRNPAGNTATIWCYTADPEMRWELCDPIHVCGDEALSENINGTDYRGCQTKTRSGKTCRHWGSMEENRATPNRYPFGGLIQNYCRNPNAAGAKTIWCYTSERVPSNNNYDWDFCDPLEADASEST